MHVILADGTFSTQSILLMTAHFINQMRLSVHTSFSVNKHVNHFIYLCYVNVVFREQVINR